MVLSSSIADIERIAFNSPRTRTPSQTSPLTTSNQILINKTVNLIPTANDNAIHTTDQALSLSNLLVSSQS